MKKMTLFAALIFSVLLAYAENSKNVVDEENMEMGPFTGDFEIYVEGQLQMYPISDNSWGLICQGSNTCFMFGRKNGTLFIKMGELTISSDVKVNQIPISQYPAQNTILPSGNYTVER